MSKTVEGAGVALAYEEHGSGAPVLLIHDMASDAQALAPVAGALAGHARVIVYDRRGYGASGAPEPYFATTVSEQAEDAAALLEALDAAGGAVVCGEGFGALVALDLALRHRPLVSAALLSDPPLYVLAPEGTAVLSAQRATLEDALRAHGPEQAIAAWFGREDATQSQSRSAAAAHRAFFADVGGLATLPIARGVLRALRVPLVVRTRASAPPVIGVVADALVGLVPGARRVDGGDLGAAAVELLERCAATRDRLGPGVP